MKWNEMYCAVLIPSAEDILFHKQVLLVFLFFHTRWIIVVSDNVSAMSLWDDREQRGRKCLKAWYTPSGKCKKKKVCSCYIITNMPLKSFAVSKYTQLVKNTQAGCFAFIEHLRYCNARGLAGCIEADRSSGSCFQMYFPDKHLFHIHHVLLLLSPSRVILQESDTVYWYK